MDGWMGSSTFPDGDPRRRWMERHVPAGWKAELGHWRRARECKPQASRRMQREQRTLCSSAPSRRHRIQDHGTRIVTPGVPFLRNDAGCPRAKKKKNITDNCRAKRTCAFINCLPVPCCNSLPNGTRQSTMPQLLGVSGASFAREHGCRRRAQGGRLHLARWRPTPLHLVRGKGDPFGDPSTKVEQNQPVYLCLPDSLMLFKDAGGWIRGRDAVDRKKVLCTEHHRYQARATIGRTNPVGSGHGPKLKA